MGMGEECAVQIAERIQNGGDLATIPYVSSNINNKIDIKDTYYFKGELDDLSYPALHLWEDGIKLMKTIPILSSRGCPYACSFCYNNQFTGRRKWYARSTQSVIDELAYWSEYFNTKEFYFVDDNMLLHTKRACDILEATLEVGYKLDQVIANLNDYKPPIVKYVIDNNVNAVMFAIESASPKIQKVLGKRQDLEKAKHIVRRFTEANINQIATNFMFGLPSEEDEDIKANIDMAYELRKINSNFRSIPYIYTPQPDDDIIKKFEFFKDVKFTYDALSTVDMSPNRTNYLTLQTRPWLTQNDIEFYLDFVLVWFYHFDHLVRSSQNIDVEAILKGNKRLGALFSDIPLPEKPSQIEVQNLAIIASTQAEMPGFRAPTE
jgi:MoaA/NifB/PqqE/SkfB family radical SAM enzyme